MLLADIFLARKTGGIVADLTSKLNIEDSDIHKTNGLHAFNLLNLLSVFIESGDQVAGPIEILTKFINMLSIFVWFKDTELRVVEANKALTDFLGFSREEFIYRSLYDFFPDEDVKVYFKHDMEVLHNGHVKTNIIETINTKHGRKCISVDKMPLRDSKNRITGVLCCAKDLPPLGPAEQPIEQIKLNFPEQIINKKDNQSLAVNADEGVQKYASLVTNLESALISDPCYRFLVEKTDKALALIEKDATISFVNSNFETFSGCRKSEIKGHKRILDFLTEDDTNRPKPFDFGSVLNAAMRTDGIDLKFIGRKNTCKLVNIRATEIHGTDGFLFSFADISRQKQIELELNENRQLSRILANNISTGVALIQKGKIVFANNAFSFIFRYEKPEALIGKQFIDLVAKDGNSNEFIEMLNTAQHGPRYRKRIQLRCLTATFRKIWLEMNCHTITLKGLPSIIATIRDITEEKLREETVYRENKSLRRENTLLKTASRQRYKLGEIVGKSSGIQKVYDAILQASESDANVIIMGETGTGKELVARAVHDLSGRRTNPFVPVNCGAIPDDLLENEFFGHKKGGFTGATADAEGYLGQAYKGTLFLDEIGDLPVKLQVKLLRAIEGSGYCAIGDNKIKIPDIRLISATNRNINELLKKGEMREDFFYRINVLPIDVPPLRERREDIGLLIDHFLEKHAKNHKAHALPGSTMDALYNYHWPGNIRELENVVQRYTIVGHPRFIENLLEENKTAEHITPPLPNPEEVKDLNKIVKLVEKKIVINALEQNHWKRSSTAAFLNIDRKTLFNKMKQFGLI